MIKPGFGFESQKAARRQAKIADQKQKGTNGTS
jgi:hypothetical protein